MIVKELIARLATMNPDARVTISVTEWVGGPFDTDQSCETFSRNARSVDFIDGEVEISS